MRLRDAREGSGDEHVWEFWSAPHTSCTMKRDAQLARDKCVVVEGGDSGGCRIALVIVHRAGLCIVSTAHSAARAWWCTAWCSDRDTSPTWVSNRLARMSAPRALLIICATVAASVRSIMRPAGTRTHAPLEAGSMPSS